MYRNFYKTIFSALAVILSVSSCQKELLEIPYGKPFEDLYNFTGTIRSVSTKTSLQGGTTSVWNADDAVGVFAADAVNKAFVIQDNMNTSAIFCPEDGEPIIGTISHLISYAPFNEEVTVSDDKLSSELPAVQKFVANSPDPAADIIMSYSLTRSLIFDHLFGMVKLKLSNLKFGTVKSVTLSSSGHEMLAGAFTASWAAQQGKYDVAMAESASEYVTLDCGEGVSITASGVDMYFVIPAGEYQQLSFDIENTDGEHFVTKTKKPLTIVQGSRGDAGIATIYIEEFFYGKTNCIHQAAAGTYEFDAAPYFTTDSYGYAYEFNTRDDLKLASSAKIIWQSQESLISAVSLSDDKKTVSFTAGAEGNALIGLFDADDTVLWSFHIWIGDFKEVTYPNGMVVLDRNLGALSATKGEVNSYGLYYQWGRKDPFPAIADLSQADVTYCQYYTADNLEFNFSAKPSASGVDQKYATSHPAEFIQRTVPDVDWVFEGGHDGLWGNPEGMTKRPALKDIRKSVYDPCPEGYMVAPIDLLTGNGIAHGIDAEMLYDSALLGRVLTHAGLDEWYPSGRQLHFNWPTTQQKSKDAIGRYWLSCPDAACKFKAMSVSWGPKAGALFPEQSQHRAFGFPVRCVKIAE